MLSSSSWCYHRVGTLSPGSSPIDLFLMDRSSSPGDRYEDWPTHRLIELLCLICRILEQRQPLAGGQPAEESPSWRNRSPARSISSWSVMSGGPVISGGPPCSSVQGQPWMSGGPPGLSGQTPSFRSSTAAPRGYNQAGGVGSRGRDAGPIAPFVCGYSCQFCQEVCSRNKTNHSHHRCRQHRHLWSETSRPIFLPLTGWSRSGRPCLAPLLAACACKFW